MNATWRPASTVGLLLLAGAPRASRAQDAVGAELWRVVGTTVPLPFALAQGTASAFWNPAQPVTVPSVAGDIVQTPDAISATGMVAVVRTGSGRLGSWGLLYGQVDLGDITRTGLTPDPLGTVPVFTRDIGLTWSLTRGSTIVGATVGSHESRLDDDDRQHFTGDLGVVQRIGGALTVAAATHFFARFATNDPGQDLYAAVEWRAWQGPLWQGSGLAAIRFRYGATLAHGAGTDHAFGVGFDLGAPFALDGLMVRENTYGNIAWRGVAGIRVKIGHYGLSFARDGGVSGLGSSYRVGLEARFR